MNSSQFQSGDILKANICDRNNGFHPIIFIDGNSDKDFIGAMITHSDYNNVNVLMDESHFKSTFDFKFENSYLVLGRFIKPEEWGPFKKIGELSHVGLEFVNESINNLPMETFNDYFNRMK
ncbi:hypothetical protein CPT03_07015 [Pedobacter ginsengisoli]|uniref:Uncharacterized protein n=1 Tax=Pedobacter ginsengisoli TaxID=363852 RepID=A0A2D1U3R7_9SPHI|nr:hypothetical protein [Pedobacter ginsengisoli]ATP56235.1 hypothetical protein CPT03_07015 [Pedobacter ginsengisoli]